MVGGSWSTRWEPTHTRGEHANSTQKGWESNLEPSGCESKVLTTTPPCSPRTLHDEKNQNTDHDKASSEYTMCGTFFMSGEAIFKMQLVIENKYHYFYLHISFLLCHIQFLGSFHWQSNQNIRSSLVAWECYKSCKQCTASCSYGESYDRYKLRRQWGTNRSRL